MTFHHAYLPPHLAAQFARERVDLNGLRDFVAIEVERLIDFLDTLDPDADFEPGADDEPSLCGVGSHEMYGNLPGYPSNGHNCGSGSRDDMEAGDFDDEPAGDDEPSLGSPNVSLLGLDVRHVNVKATRRLPDEPFAVGSGDDREHDDADGPEGDDEREGVHGSSSGTDDDEPSLCGITVNSLFATGPAAWDGEMSLGSLGGTAVDCEGSQVNNARGDRTDKEEDTGSRTHNKSRESSWSPSPAVKAVREDLRRRADAKWLARRGTGNVTLIGIR